MFLSAIFIWWSHLGLNQGLPDYESGALTNWAIGPACHGLATQSGCKVSKISRYDNGYVIFFSSSGKIIRLPKW